MATSSTVFASNDTAAARRLVQHRDQSKPIRKIDFVRKHSAKGAIASCEIHTQ